MSYLTQPAHADAQAIAAILSTCAVDTTDAAVKVAREVLKKAVIDGADTVHLRSSLAQHGGRAFATCHGDGVAVMFMGKHALVFATQGGEVPWVRSDRLHAPDVDFFKCRVTVGQHVSDSLVALVQVDERTGDADATEDFEVARSH